MKCARKDCETEAKWRPVLLLRPRGTYGGKPHKMQVSVDVCDEHKTGAAEVYLTDDVWITILKVFDAHKKARPHRSASEVVYLSLDDPEALDLTPPKEGLH